MNKKFLSAVLFGALLASTTGTFTSCKDYDDDINGLNERVDAIEKTLADLNAKFGSLAYVKSVSIADGKIVVTDQDGKPSSYTIPTTTDTNTTYTLDVTQEGNTATITLTDDKGGKQTKTISFTDTDTDTDTKFDATKLVLGEDGVVSYEGKPTGVKITKPETFTLTIVKYQEDGVTIGWDINGTKLLITDALPITGFEYIPNKILAGWGERVIVFEEHSYLKKEIAANAVENTDISLYMSNMASPEYQVNPSSASIAQLENEGKAVILNKTLEQVTRTPGGLIEWKKTAIVDGVMTVSLEANPALFQDEENKLDVIALQFETTAKNKITTEYVGVINKADEIDLRFTDASVNEKNDGTDANHFALSKADAIAQKAMIDVNNMPLADNATLVQNVTYTKATTTGYDLADLISTCNVKDAAGHKFFDYTKYPDLKLSFEAVPYKVKDTPQEKYMSLNGNTFKAVNYGNTDPVCIGKAPMVLAKLTDSHNGNALVAAAYIKLLIVADEAAKPEEDIIITKDATIGIGCNDPVYNWSTDDEFMSTQVYKFNSNDKLIGLSKEQFHNLYSYTTIPVAGYTNVGDWTVEEILTTDDNKANHGADFTLNTAPLAAGTYYAYAVYTKTTDADIIVSVQNGGMYPEHVVIKHVVKVDAVNFTATSREKAPNAWNGNTASIYCQTPGTGNTTRIVGDLNELFVGGKVEFEYSSEFDANKYPSFVLTKMDYRFVFSAKNEKGGEHKPVIGVDNKEYQLVVSDDNTKLYAVSIKLTGAAIAAACTEDKLVATLSGDNNNKVEYANTDIAKNLLNKESRSSGKSFYAIMDIVFANGCGLTVDVIKGEFNLAFIRPVNVSANSDKFFTDGLNVDDPSNVLNLGELVNFTDWRKDSPLNSFAAHLDYYKYYGVTRINCTDIKKIKTNWTGEGKEETLEEAFGAEVAAQIIKVDSKTVTYGNEVTKLPDFGTVTYIKTSGAEIKDYELYIPLTITYTWGTIEKTITVKVKATK